MSPSQSTILNHSGYQALSATSEKGQPCDKNISPRFQTHTVKTYASNNSVPLREDKGHPFFIFCLLSFFNEELECKCNLKEEKK